MRTFLIVASLLTVALAGIAPSASAGPFEQACQDLVDTCDFDQCGTFEDPNGDPCDTLAAIDDGVCPPACGLPPIAPDDADNDGIPDILEALLCGSTAQQTAIGATGQASCASASDLVLSPDASVVTGPVGVVLGILLGVVGTVTGLVDGDGDNVPDEAEPVLCLVENQNFPQDGTCTGSDYHPYV